MSVPRALADELVLDELLDLTLYRELHPIATGDLRKMLGQLIMVEEGHYTFWRNLFGQEARPLDWSRRAKLRLVVVACRVFGDTMIHLVLEAIEIYGIRKYLAVWRRYRGEPLGESVKEILSDEFQHEEEIVAGMTGRKINPERVRNFFLGLNDGLVEILGALSGFFAAFGRPPLVIMASTSVAVAGSLSMAAGAYVASSSEGEVRRIEAGRAEFLGTPPREAGESNPVQAALIVGFSYFAGALIPVLPIMLGATTMVLPLLVAGLMIVAVSLIVAFLSGMDIRKRIALNAVVMSGAVAISYAIGVLAKRVWGISL